MLLIWIQEEGFDTGQQVVNNCIIHHLVFPFLLTLLLFAIIIVFYLNFIFITLFLSHSSCTLDIFPIPLGKERL